MEDDGRKGGLKWSRVGWGSLDDCLMLGNGAWGLLRGTEDGYLVIGMTVEKGDLKAMGSRRE